jgi:hypothetical protein
MAGGSVVALASAHRRVVEARCRVERQRDARSDLLRSGELAAAARSASTIREMDLDLAYLETVLVAATAQVHHEFNMMQPRGGGGPLAR